MAGRFIKLYDKILNWEWYRDINTFRLFIHLLLKANYKDQYFQGNLIKRGQLTTSLTSLASQTGLSERQVRVSLDKLKMTGEVSSSTCPRYRIITILRYDEYQSDGRQNVTLVTGKLSASRQAECHPRDRQTVSQDVSQNVTKYRNIEDIEHRTDRNIESPLRERGKTAKRFIPPTREEIEDFCLSAGIHIDVDRFLDYYTANGWIVGKTHMKDWRATVRNWARRDKTNVPAPKAEQKKVLPAQDFEQRDYDDIDAMLMERLAAEMRAEREAEEGTS